MTNQLILKTASLVALLCPASILFTESTPAQEPIEVTETDGLKDSSDSTVQIRLDPAGEKLPVPALKYLLLPHPADLRRGNAAVHYGKAATGGAHFYRNGRIEWARYMDYLSTTLDELRKLPVDKYPRSLSFGDWDPDHAPFLAPLRNAALCRSCDLEIPFRDKTAQRMRL